MSNYRVDQPSSRVIVQHLRNMDDVLREIMVTYEVLGELLERQEQALQAPALNRQRQALQQQVRQAAVQAEHIAVTTGRLAERSHDLTGRIVALEQQAEM